ncbi:hypothetical protein B7Y94_05490 [Candidatus Saccharibacteria bacterium 32-49-12]|nr:MAG: hypothetical protein B7Y94_05490 [Candidatus Saccharibacteria bacterium 32-49-12]
MELLKFVRRRSFLSEVVYNVLNVALAVAVVLTVYYTESVWLGILIVLISKWRILSVRPRYWLANFLSNLVDIIVSVSLVVLMHVITRAPEMGNQIVTLLGFMTLLYIVWLLFIKPRSKRSYVVAQAGIATLLGSWALFTVSYNWPVSVVVLGMWVIGFTAARHVLSHYDDETHTTILSLIWGLILAEIGWVAYHWTIAYSLPLTTSLLMPQVSIIAVLVGFVGFKSYDSFVHHQKIRMTDVILPLLFSVSVALVLVLVFNRVGTAI